MSKVKFLVFLIVMLSAPAKERESLFDNSDAKFLIESCREVIEIFKRRDETSFLAAQRTSLSEGMRAGYCIGVLQQYSKTSSYCSYSRRNWFQMAKAIADIPVSESLLSNSSSDSLLRELFCGR